MNKEKPRTNASAVPKCAEGRRRINIQQMQNVLLIWLDSSIDETNDNCQNAITRIRRAVNDINTYTDVDQCFEFIETVVDKKACMIISGSLGQHFVPFVHNMPQIDSIFIFCDNRKHHEQWTKDWPKIKGVFTDITPICEALKEAAHQCEQNAISMSFVGTNKKLDQLDPPFMYTQIIKEIILTIEFDQKHIQDYFNYCRDVFADNEKEIKNIKQLEDEYHKKTPIYWYTCQMFLYPMLNRALRLMDGDIITRMGFFIGDLHRHLEQLHREQYAGTTAADTFTVYRGQGLSTEDFEKMRKIKGGLISFNNFLSTSKDREVSHAFAESNQANPDLFGVLFVMKVDPSQSTTPFASIAGISHFQEEEEVVFSMHSVFRIQDIKQIDGNNHLYEVNLILTADNDPELSRLTDYIRQENFPDEEEWYRLGMVLIKMGQFDKAEDIYQVLLDQTKDDKNKAPIYHQLGWIKDNQGKYEDALTFYEISLAIGQKTLPLSDTELAKAYNNIGNVHDNMGNYPEALSCHEKALEIQQLSLPANHPDLAYPHNNIGNAYRSMGNYPKALSYYEKSLEIQQKSLPPNHPNLAVLYSNIGLVYASMGNDPKALSSHEKALEIRQQSLPPNHPDLSASYNNIGLVYKSMEEYSKALSFHEKALEIQQQSLPANHPDLAMSYNNIGNIHYDMGNYPKALSSHEKALEIQQQSLPANHPDWAKSYNNTGNVHTKMGNYPEALSYYEKTLEIQQKSLPPNHPDLAYPYNNIGEVHRDMSNYPKALSYYEKALEIQQQSLPPNHPDFASSYNDIGSVYAKMGSYSEARTYYEHAIQIGEQSLPSNHSDLQNYRNNLEDVKKKINCIAMNFIF
ncbi:unnamed protein product [Adineta steineri]|uniref:ADP ribosyltransferase domain-containing protein n=1 Tax=Adineta steineri TaxID=433720 RepID=A0A819PDC7_9BILA|nr:unnamed protein product [Adineta steineri]CAF1425348.1 unnamed protein product [Adineta steineri]CAF3947258.1 unnamed protein product [Adineta steineri]CAF4007956.1 unnamed protein product [Adineta steineri]CAF4077922.1 unnamed protein product [Adineta steineri]